MATKTAKSAAPSAATKADVKAATIAALGAQLLPTPTKPVLSLAPAEKSAASRSNWKGVLTGFGPLNISVQTYKATEEEKLSLNTIHICNADAVAKGDKPVYTQLKQGKMNCPVCVADVEKADQLSGYKYAEGSFVTVSDDELKALAVKSDKVMHIESFAPASSVDPIYFSNTEYIAAQDAPSNEFFNLLRGAMVTQGTVAIAKSNQRGREQTVAIRPYGTNGMAVHYLYFDNEVRSMDKWSTVAVDDAQAEIAAMLIESMTEPFDITKYEDTTMRAKKGLINDKVSGRAPVTLAAPTVPVASTSAIDVMALLKADLAARKSAKTAKAMAATA